MKLHGLLKTVLFFSLALSSNAAYSFCGFYAARAGATLYNKASKVVVAQDSQYQAITMASDYEGNAKDFALVVPVPKVLKRHQINTVDSNVITHLDNYTAPRLVEYFDESPCRPIYPMVMAAPAPAPVMRKATRPSGPKSLGVTIEAKYAVGVYDILLLSAKQSNGLVTWLKQNKYQLPNGAEPVIKSYLDMGMRFFVAKVNMTRQAATGGAYLKPIRINYHSSNFMLPIRLGMLNAKGKQELFVYHLNRKGRVISTNYPNVKLNTDKDIPLFNKKEFGKFYKAMFENQVKQNRERGVFLEYAWDMSWCDPCAADPLSNDELKQLGVFWTQAQTKVINGKKVMRPAPRGAAKNVFVTRLHLSYDKEHFPQDLAFKATNNRENFQGRFIVRHAWKGKASECKQAKTYLNKTLPKRYEKEAQTMANLTGWDIAAIRKRMNLVKTAEKKSSFGNQRAGSNQVKP